nr:hypothetical protein [Tanacetum cinerariifolium]
MLNKENYVPWSSRLLRYAKSRPNGKLIYNSIINGPYVRRMIPEPGDQNREVPEIWLRVLQMTKGSDIGIQKKKAKFFNEWERKDCQESQVPKQLTKEVHELRAEQLARTHDPLALMANSNNPFNYLVFHQDQPSPSTFMQQPQPNKNYNPQPLFNQNYMQQPMLNPKDITDPTTAMNMTLVLMAKAFKLNYSTPTNNNQRISSNPRNRKIAQPGMNLGQDRHMRMVGGNGGNRFRQLIVVPGIVNHNRNGNFNVVAARAEGNANRNNSNQIRCYNCRGLGDLDETEEVNANCILMANLQQASISSSQTDKAPVYDSEDQLSVEQGGGTVEQHSATVEETRAYHESLFHNLSTEFEKVNSFNRKIKETNAGLTTELARYKNQEKCFKISQEKYDKLERCY